MDRSLYPEGVEVHQTALQSTEDSKTFHIQRRSVDTTRTGRASGFGLTIGTPTSRFNVGAGTGYTSRADFVENAGSANVALADYTLGVENLIVVVYRENLGSPAAHEDGGATRNTIASRSSELKVITRTEFTDMPASASGDLATNLRTADLTTDAQDRVVVLASVLGKGFSLGVPVGYIAGDFTNGNIVQQALFGPILTAALPAVPLITGLNIRSVAASTPVGVGSLVLTVTNPTTKAITWQAPGDGSPGASQPIDLSQNLDTYTLLSSTTSRTLTVEIVPVLLPTANGTYTDAVAVSSFYDDTAGSFSGRDELHRSKLGSYVPTQVDGHGMGYPDFAQQVAVIPRPILAGTGALSTLAQALLARITTPRSTVGGVARTLMWELTGGSYTIRFYKTSSDALEIVSNAAYDGTNWVRDSTSAGVLSTRLSLGSNGISEFVYDGGSSPFSDGAWKQVLQSDQFNVTTPRQGLLKLGQGFMSGADLTNPRVEARFNGRTLLWESTNFSGGAVSGTRFYANAGVFELVINALWGGATWTQDNPAARSMRITFDENASIFSNFQSPGAGPWNDTGWADYPDLRILASAETGDIIHAGNLIAGQRITGGNLAHTNATQARFSATIDPSGSPKRFLIQEVAVSGGAFWRKYVTFPAGSPYAHTEETFNCRWTGTQWDYDSVGFGDAVLYRFGYPYTLALAKTGGGHPWADTGDPITPPSTGIGGFSRIEYLFTHAGGGLALLDHFGTSAPNPNTLYGNMIPRAWGRLTFATGVDPVLSDSIGCTWVSADNTTGEIVVSFEHAMANANYPPPFFSNLNVITANAGATLSDPFPVRATTVSQSSSAFTFKLIGTNNSNGNQVCEGARSAAANGVSVGFVVFARQ